MKHFFTVFFLSVISFSAFAGTATSWKNEALDFVITAVTYTDVITICDSSDNCLEFKPTQTLGRTTAYTEVSGKCSLTMELVDQNYRDGSTSDEFMLDIMFQVVKVQSGAENCKLNALSGKRSLTGIYL